MKTNKNKVNYWQKFEENGCYHVYNRGNNKENIFVSENNYYFFLYKWNYYIAPYAETLAYCLMPNHFHFLIRIKPFDLYLESIIRNLKTHRAEKFCAGIIVYNTFLEDQFKRLFSSYAMAFNHQQKRTGSLFQKRFKRISINNEAKLIHLLSYIHHNPIHHGYSKDFDGWKFSSYKSYMRDSIHNSKLHFLQQYFDSDLESAKALFEEYHLEFKSEKKIYSLYLE